MSQSIKKFLIESINDWEQEIEEITSECVESIEDVRFDKESDFIKIDFNTSFGVKASIVVPWTKFKSWFSATKKEKKPYLCFVKEFLKVSELKKKELSEIIDDDGNIIGDDEQPPDTTNSMIGTSKWDTDKVYHSGVPKSVRMYSGDLGIGIVTW